MSKTHYLQLTLNQKETGVSEVEPEGDLAVSESRQEIKPPPMFVVIMLNDDFTPMDFVVEVLEKFFNMSREKATQIMLMVHIKGRATCGTYTKDVAETKASQVNRYARENQHPLLCEIQQVQS